ncbi:MAG: hypothetical protein V4864_15285 [Pseudomonadota bacterium]
MKSLLAICLVAIAPALALAQTTTPAKPAAKPKAGKPVSVKKVPPTSKRQAVEEATPIEEPDPSVKLGEADLATARRVYTGEIPCELGANVKVTPLKREGFFLVVNKLNRFVMHPVESRTGAIRLEDPARGAMWLQLGNKSMLMSQKLGQRLADECQSPEQAAFADNLKKNPMPSILEPAPAASAAKPASN